MSYDADGGRVRARRGDTQVDVVTLGKLYERRVNKNGTTAATTWRIEAGERVVAQIVRTRDNLGAYTTSNQYLHDDDLGSTVLVTASAGMGDVDTVARTSSDPWGRARNPDNWNAWQTDAQAGAVGIGFTGHRAELDHGLIDADGRMYDPTSGRFMAPDPLVTQAYAGATYNRYAYVGNRPLRFTDPSGWAASDGGDDGGGFEDSSQLEEFYDHVTGEFAARVGSAISNGYYEIGHFVEDVEFGDLYSTVVIEPIAWVAKRMANQAAANLDGILATAEMIANRPEDFVVEVAGGLLRDVETVLRANRGIDKAIREGRYRDAVSIWTDAAQSAFNVASFIVRGGATKVTSVGAKAGLTATVLSGATGMLDFAAKTLSALKHSGVYVHTFQSGKVYVGKGGWNRAMKSGKQISSKHSDPLVKTEWYWMKNSREAFKEEARVLKRYGGHKR
jgi:RHS repeat-associated protein